MRLIDTHTHLFLKEFEADLDLVIENARNNDVEKVFLPNVDCTSIASLFNLVNKYPDFCYPLMGLHPTSVTKNYLSQIETIKYYIENNKVYGVGEIGIDLYWDTTLKKEQEEAFRIQIEIAKKNNLPIIIHARDSFDEIFKIVDEVIDVKQAEQVVDWGFLIGIGGIVTFKNSNLKDVVNNIDINHIVLETDSPYLAPVPKRGKRNESAYVRYIAEKIAEIKNMSLESVAEITSKNAERVFNI